MNMASKVQVIDYQPITAVDNFFENKSEYAWNYQDLAVSLLYEIERDTIDTSNDHPTPNTQSV